MNLQLVTGPAVDVVSLEDAKTHLRVDGTAEDTLITAQIKAATRFCEALCDRVFVEQTWRLSLHGFPSARDDRGQIVLPISRLISVTSITYVDANGEGLAEVGGIIFVAVAIFRPRDGDRADQVAQEAIVALAVCSVPVFQITGDPLFEGFRLGPDA